MEQSRYRELEDRAYQFLHKEFLNGRKHFTVDELEPAIKNALSITDDTELETLVWRLQHSALQYNGMKAYDIRPQIIEDFDRRARASRPDRVEQVYRAMRSHPIWSLILIALFVTTTLATLLNQTLQLLERFGLLDPR